MAVEKRAMRSDARANRQVILSAAADAYRRSGLDASFEDIAQAAGVGRATLYRHFPTRDALLGALFERAVAEIDERARQSPDATDPLGHLLRLTVEVLVDHLPLIDTLRSHGPLPADVVGPTRARLSKTFAGPLADAKAAGDVRHDVTDEDLRVIVAMLAAVVRPNVPAEDRERGLRLADAALGRR